MLRGVHDGIRIDLVVPVQVGDGAGLAEVFDAEGGGHVAGDGADPGQRGRVAVSDRDQRRIARHFCHQPLDLALGRAVAAGPCAAGGRPA